MADIDLSVLESPELEEKIGQWFTWDKNEKTRSYIRKLVECKNQTELQKRFAQRLEFGTAGLRGSMGAGTAHMNDLVIIQTTQGFAKYLLKTIPDIKQRGVIIGFDNRHNSERFSELAANAFLSQSIPVYRCSRMCPTPFVPFAVLHLKCAAGLMITASHNPKNDNGYKVYWTNGAQITSPHDKGIASAIEENLTPWEGVWDYNPQHPLLKDPLDEVLEAYLETLKPLCHYRDLNKSASRRFVYTPMHGVGQTYMNAATKVFQLADFVPVVEQQDPDPEFPTVKYPNPEEGKSSLDLSVATAEKAGISIILANDPDADRFALAEKLPSGSWKIYSGNEIGTLLGWWLWHCHVQKPNHTPGSDCYMIASTVSSKMLRAVAALEGFHFEETLTGFKWIANRASDLRAQGKTVLFGYEEAIGFMCNDRVLDKDGISACLICAEMINWLDSQGLTPSEQLEKLQEKYGFHITNSSYFLCYDPPVIKSMFDRLRNFGGPNQYPKTCGEFHVKNVRDLTVGYDDSQPNNKPNLPVSKSSQMITFTFEEGIVATLRTSGTEPKIKYYTEICGKPGERNKEQLQEKLNRFVQSLITEYFEPEKNCITLKSD